MALTSQGSAAKQIDSQADDSEPSMEEILASIRQIISEDEGTEDGLTERERYTHPTDPSNSNKPLSDAQLNAGSPSALANAKGEPQPSLEERAAKVRASLAARHEASRSAGDAQLKTEALAQRMETTVGQTGMAQDAAAQPVLSSSPPIPRYVAATPVATAPVQVAPVAAPNVVIEQMASTLMREKGDEIDSMLGEMMRPIVRKWLGDNLPTLVERLVREEIERVSRGKRGA